MLLLIVLLALGLLALTIYTIVQVVVSKEPGWFKILAIAYIVFILILMFTDA